MPELIIRSGKHEGKRLTIPNHDTLIGRGEECQVRLASADVSKLHCLLRVTPDGMTVRDLGSRNGTFVNDVPALLETPLRPGDRLRVGPMIFQVPLHKPADPHKPAPKADRGDSPSDDDIAAWLHDEAARSGTGDTTIITGSQAAAMATPSAEPAPAIDARPADRGHRTVAEEAREIIQRWQQVKAARAGG